MELEEWLIMAFDLQLIVRGEKVEAPDLSIQRLSRPNLQISIFSILYIYNIITPGLAWVSKLRPLAVHDIVATACIASNFMES